MPMILTIAKSTLTVALKGEFSGYYDPAASNEIWKKIHQNQIKEIVFEDNGLKKWDSTLVAVIYQTAKLAKEKSVKLEMSGLPESLQKLVYLALEVDRKPEKERIVHRDFFDTLGNWGYCLYQSVRKGSAFIQQVLSSFLRFLGGGAVMRKVDFLFAVEESSYKAVAIVSLVSFMIGLILAFVGAIQLKTFGAQIYVASLVAIGMTRIMGAIMVGVIMAGRTGAAFAATIGTMQVNEEIDALKTMGVPITDFLVLPRVMALTITMPILVVLADFMGILGGAAVGTGMLGISAPEYWQYTLKALNMPNFWVGVFHGFVFGIVIALCGCYYGVNCGRNADSVGVATTKAVVSAIVWMIVVTGILTMIFEALGI